MDGLLTEVKTVTHDRDPSLSIVKERPVHGLERHDATSKADNDADPTSADYILTVLKSRPDRAGLSDALNVLDPSNKYITPKVFDIRVPSPTTAQILNVLGTITVPDHWASLNVRSKGSTSEDNKLRAALLRCFSSVSGISCLVTQLLSLMATARSSSQQAKASGSQIQIRDILTILSALLKPKDLILRIYMDIEALYSNATQQQVAWREFLSLIAASKVLSATAEALTLAGDFDSLSTILWIGDGAQYTSWLGTNICHMVSKFDLDNQDAWKAVASLTGRALSLGYIDHLARELYTSLLINETLQERYGSLFDTLRPMEQLAVLEATFREVEKKYFLALIDQSNEAILGQRVNGVAGLCSSIIGEREHIKAQLLDWLSKGQGGSIQTIGLRRALLASFTDQKESMRTLLKKSLEQSSDKFYIKHAPIVSQEANTQVLLLAAGYLKRLNSNAIVEIGRSSAFLNTVSNRLAASSSKARFLGMIIGMSISQLIEQPGKAMKFDLEEMEGDEALWYFNLVNTQDSVGSFKSIVPTDSVTKSQQPAKSSSTSATATRKSPPLRTAKIVAIEEIESENEESEEDEDLIPYEKPDEDPYDSDEDPTLVQRNKPTAPVYIRDLIIYLRDTENIERFELAISTAPSLIRRKTDFGTELAENIEELALVIVGLQEQSKFPKFHEYRLQSIIALIVSQPLKMGRWFTAMFFDGDLSQVQRSAVLTGLGLSAREIAGNGENDARTLGLPTLPDASFPSKKLPANLEALYSSNESPIASLTKKLAQTSLQPLAANAADSLSGPNALKVRTFSSRMEVEKQRQQREAQRQKSVAKDLYKVLAEGFFHPLKSRFEMMMLQFASSTAPSYNPFITPNLLTLFIQTLTLTLSTMGPHTPYLPTVTEDALTFLLSLHTRPVSDDPTIISALLALFLAIVDLNVASGSTGEERLVTELAPQVIELREWAGEVFDRTPAVKGDGPREQVRTFAAGVMVKLGEVMERYQGRLMGVNSGFKY
ncbi:telomere length regulation protein-domain-containing protein [Aspergillus transmontanensis]|uniref:Telomere length regulation protein-domain-containing protein n=1 Tax=Aspergillus transmontanensis TaxID=1034304 RepID=A0A5N6WFL2_9EURO|nr:telomere length regulation protein-domain-containing protein [Aspergillus transmontanensis]